MHATISASRGWLQQADALRMHTGYTLGTRMNLAISGNQAPMDKHGRGAPASATGSEDRPCTKTAIRTCLRRPARMNRTYSTRVGSFGVLASNILRDDHA